MIKSFEELVIWQDARTQANVIHSAFINLKDFEFKNQINAAAISVMNNIAEGFERFSKADFKRFLQIAKASNAEVRSMIYLAEDYGYLSPVAANDMRDFSIKIKNEITRLINS